MPGGPPRGDLEDRKVLEQPDAAIVIEEYFRGDGQVRISKLLSLEKKIEAQSTLIQAMIVDAQHVKADLENVREAIEEVRKEWQAKKAGAKKAPGRLHGKRKTPASVSSS
jgi:hypothetical protein